MSEFILNLIYPNVCGICNKICSEGLCKKCKLSIKQYEINKVVDCNKSRGKYFDYSLSIFKYEDIIRKKIIEYKFSDKPYLYRMFSKIILENEKTFGLFKNKYDIIIPVPIYKKKKRERGYNQTELIARNIAKSVIDLEYSDKVLLKTKSTRSQSLLSKKERKSNIKDVFGINNKYIEKIKDKKIILFDDIYTTGSTVNECSKVLKADGAREVLVLTIAKD